MHFIQVQHIVLGQNNMNLYRSCFYGCIYCDSRGKCYQMNHQFEDIEIKSNVIELLKLLLKKKRKKL